MRTPIEKERDELFASGLALILPECSSKGLMLLEASIGAYSVKMEEIFEDWAIVFSLGLNQLCQPIEELWQAVYGDPCR